jgi:hypothetical protein
MNLANTMALSSCGELPIETLLGTNNEKVFPSFIHINKHYIHSILGIFAIFSFQHEQHS